MQDKDQTFIINSDINIPKDQLRSLVQADLVEKGIISSKTAYEDGEIDFRFFDVQWYDVDV